MKENEALNIYRKYYEKRDELSSAEDKEFMAVRHSHFPIGTQVSWKHGQNQIVGVVVDHCHRICSDQVIVENTKSRSRKEVKMYDLTII